MDSTEKALQKGEVYKDFEVLDVVALPDLSGEGIWLRHRATGMEIFHLLNQDEENLFAFAFKTPPQNSTGVAHVLEHSVLCGSKNYPLKDPFIRLANQSVKTFLNAMTFSDKTVYPASSISQVDYFNLMAVYGDAVFFPLLEEWTFNQEGHRLELDSQDEPTIQGVVYNEMKGNYSSFENVAGDWVLRSVLKDTIYDLDSGGDPTEIPLLSYQDFLKFHRDHYNPGNCRLFLAGNIPTRQQIDFICQRFLDCYDKTVEELAALRGESSSDSHPVPPVRNLLPLEEPPAAFQQPMVMECQGPGAADESGSIVTVTWFLGDSSSAERYMETVLLAEILMGHDGSPLSQALLESGLGEDLAPNCGIDSEMHWVLLTAGLRGCHRDKAEEVEGLIRSVLEKMVREGVRQEDIDSAVLSVDFSQREVRRVNGPYSLILMRRCLRGWLYGRTPFETISNRSAFARIKERIATDKEYVAGLISRLLLENNHRSRVTVYPHQDFAAQMQRQEQELIQQLMKGTSIEEITARHQRLVEFQQGSQEEDASILPHISPKELSVDVDNIQVRRQEGPNGVPVFVSQEATNGVVYVELCFPVDLLEPAEYPLLPFLAGSLTNVGFGDTSWVEAARRAALETGNMGASVFTSAMMNKYSGRQREDQNGQLVEDPVLGRDWLFVKGKLLSEQSQTALALLAEVLMQVDFSDHERLSNLVKEYRNDFVASLVPNGHDYANSRCSRTFSRSKAVDEVWNGLSQLSTIKSLVEGDMREIGPQLARIFERIRSSGAVVHITADQESLEVALPLLEKLVVDCKLVPPRQRLQDNTQEFIAMTELGGKELDDTEPSVAEDSCSSQEALQENLELLPGDFQVGFTSASCASKGLNDESYVYVSLLSHWITNTSLWEQIRTVGGAYGAFAWPDASERVFSFATYRDPKPLRSLQVFRQVLFQAAQEPIDQQELERVITGCYSKEVQPKSPSTRGSMGFLQYLYGYTHAIKQRKLELLLATRPEHIQQAAKDILSLLQERVSQAAILNGKEVIPDDLKHWKNVRQVDIISENTR